MWWRRCKTAHTLVTTFANCFVTLATSCKILEVLIILYSPHSLENKRKYKENNIIIMKLIYPVLCYNTNKPFKEIKLLYYLI